MSLSTWVVETSDGRTAAITADDLRVTDGALVLSRAPGAPPEALRPVVLFARGAWRSVHLDTEPRVSWTPSQLPPAEPKKHGPIAK